MVGLARIPESDCCVSLATATVKSDDQGSSSRLVKGSGNNGQS